jgi:hypothetical protein
VLDSLETVSDYKLTDLLGSASATIGIIIAGTIFLQFMSAKFMELTNRYRTLTGEYRGGGAAENRHGMLQAQIRNYRRRLWLINRASWLAGVALLCFLISVLVGGLSMVYPPVVTFKGVGTIALFIGLVLIGGAVILQFIESIRAAHEIDEETGDLDGPAKSES